MKKFPLVRFKQFINNPVYMLFWLKRTLIYKRTSYKYVPQIKKISQKSPSETLNDIITRNLSVIRFGDGEFGLLSGAGIYPPDSDWSQRYSKELSQNIEQQMTLCDQKILIAFPPKQHLIYKDGDKPQLDVIPSMHTEARIFLWRYLNPNQVYGDWSVFMPHHNIDLDWEKIRTHINSKTVVIVSGGTDNLRDVQLGARTLFVECGKHDAFERRFQIIAKIDSLIKKETLNSKQTIFWVSLGCTAGCIVEHLVDHGFVGWDTGHIFRFAEQELKNLSL
jgi:hypothetical protein